MLKAKEKICFSLMFIILILGIMNPVKAQIQSFDFKTERKNIQNGKDISINSIDSVGFTYKKITAVAGIVLKHWMNNVLLEYLYENNEHYYNMVKPAGEGTGCTLYIDPSQNYTDQTAYLEDIIFYLPPGVVTDSSGQVFMRNNADKRYWVECQILIITMYQEAIRKDELFITSLKALGEVDQEKK